MATAFYNFSLGGFFEGMDAVFLFWILAFLVLFLITRKVFTTIFKNQKGVANAISLIISTLVIYWLSKSYYLDLDYLRINHFIHTIAPILPWLLVLAAFIIVFKWGLCTLFIIFGAIVILTVFSGGIYEKGIGLIIGISSFLIGLIFCLKKHMKKGTKTSKSSGNKKRMTLKILIKGNGATKPHSGTYYLRPNKIKRIKVKKGDLDYWLVNGTKYTKVPLRLKMTMDYNVVAVFKAGSSNPSRIDILIDEAKKFRIWADTQKNPKLYRNWAHFINWLKKRGYGSSESDIMNKLNVTKNDIIHVVGKYIK